MIGNDVVDLGDAETRAGAEHPGFDARVFCEAERDRLAHAADPRGLRWSLWAGKEAAYKVLRRLDPRFVFSPRALEVVCDEAGRGSVRSDATALPLRIARRGDRVVAVAYHPDIAPGAIAEHHVEGHTGRASLRDALVAALREEARGRGFAGRTARIEREGRIPVFCVGERRLPLSIAHHGRFASAALLWSPDEP